MARSNHLKDYQKEQKLHNNRANTAIVLIFVSFTFLFIHLYRLQILEYDRYTTFSKNNRINLLPIPPNRGLIYDRNGILLAENKPVYQLEINLKQIKSLKETIKNINAIIPITEADEQRFYDLLKRNWLHRGGMPIKTNLTEEEMALFAVNRHNFPGVEMTAKLIRYYPYKDQLVHVLGYVGRINDDELEKIDQENYAGTQYIGKLGIEKYYEDILHGKVGRQEVEMNARGRINKVLQQILPTAGNDLYLTIDMKLQELAVGMMKDKRGALVALDPKTGEVFALVSTPGYDPNMFVEGIPPSEYKKLQQDADKPLFNRALRGQYPPGSTVKPLLAMGGLINGTVTPYTTISDPGYFVLPGESHVYNDMAAHGQVDLKRSIIVSCNVYYFKLAYQLGIDNLEYIFKQFGYGVKSSLDITEELPGIVPSPTWKRDHRGGVWYPGETVITGIGQGYLIITPMQLAQAASIIANKGNHASPHLLLQQRVSDNEFIINNPEVAETVFASYPDAWNVIHEAMQGVVTEGTARSIRYPENYTIGGKTGTAQVVKLGRVNSERTRDHKLFMAFAPVEDPQIAVGVIMENEGGSGVTPTGKQIARKVMDYYLLSSDNGIKIQPPKPPSQEPLIDVIGKSGYQIKNRDLEKARKKSEELAASNTALVPKLPTAPISQPKEPLPITTSTYE